MFVSDDDYCFDIFGTITSNRDWEWEEFLQVMANAKITVNIQRKGDAITYKTTIDSQEGKSYHYNVINTNAPTSEMTFSLTCEESLVDLLRVETKERVGEEVTHTPTPANTETDKVTTDGTSIFIRSSKDQEAPLYSADGKCVSTLHLSSGWNQINALCNGVYFLLGQKVVLQRQGK